MIASSAQAFKRERAWMGAEPLGFAPVGIVLAKAIQAIWLAAGQTPELEAETPDDNGGDDDEGEAFGQTHGCNLRTQGEVA
jgi:hypothetical protein